MASLDDFTLKISELIERSLDFDKELDEVLDKTAEDIISDIKETAPIGNSNEHLKDSFTALKEGTKVNKSVTILNKSVTIYSKSKGRLVHLIEFGFVHRSGRFVSARPFLRPSYEKEAPKMEEKIREAIKNATNKT